jgi:AcrR family transcriptional regulator
VSDGAQDARPLRPVFGAPGSTANRIVQAAWLTAGQQGTKKLSIGAICKAAKVSRATFYRHFATKDEVLSALSEFVSHSFIQGLRDAVIPGADPADTLHRVLSFHWRFSHGEQTSGIFEVEPEFVIGFLRAHFDAHVAAMVEALEPVFDHIEAVRGTVLDRRQIADSLIRLGLSTVLVPSQSSWESTEAMLFGLMNERIGANDPGDPGRATGRTRGARAGR